MKRKGSFSAVLIAVVALILLAATLYLSMGAIAGRRAVCGETLLQERQYALSYEAFKDAEKYNRYLLRKNQGIVRGLAESSYGIGNYGEALSFYTLLAAAEPEDAEVRYRLGLLYIDVRDMGKAREQIEALEQMRTYEAQDYADELTERMDDGNLKGLFKDIYDKVAPRLPGFPGSAGDLMDRLPRKKNNIEKREGEPGAEVSPDAVPRSEGGPERGQGAAEEVPEPGPVAEDEEDGV